MAQQRADVPGTLVDHDIVFDGVTYGNVSLTANIDVGIGIPGVGGLSLEVGWSENGTGLRVEIGAAAGPFRGEIGADVGSGGVYGSFEGGLGSITGLGANKEVFAGTVATYGFDNNLNKTVDVEVTSEVSLGVGFGTGSVSTSTEFGTTFESFEVYRNPTIGDSARPANKEISPTESFNSLDAIAEDRHTGHLPDPNESANSDPKVSVFIKS